ncbi:MAG: hypothetical protein A2521_17480 [Deltaproteobacteria bacterium RIFOXYD12_FULL_57_12]|nr:MAG: hypothetical protein A2521_17480 [Deltaproteobacteria bacterium RIFOXYD12_FULL_57_12]
MLCKVLLQLLSVNRSTYCYQPTGETALNLELMHLINEQYLEKPWYGSRKWRGICAVTAMP